MAALPPRPWALSRADPDLYDETACVFTPRGTAVVNGLLAARACLHRSVTPAERLAAMAEDAVADASLLRDCASLSRRRRRAQLAAQTKVARAYRAGEQAGKVVSVLTFNMPLGVVVSVRAARRLVTGHALGRRSDGGVREDAVVRTLRACRAQAATPDVAPRRHAPVPQLCTLLRALRQDVETHRDARIRGSYLLRREIALLCGVL